MARVPDWNILVDRFLRDHGARLVRHVSVTTIVRIAAVIRRERDAGKGVDGIARALALVFPDIDRTRGLVIGRTETTRAQNYGTFVGAVESGGVDFKEWIAELVGARDSHAEADGDVVRVSEKFVLNGKEGPEYADYPGDPALSAGESINCRCTLAFLTADEVQRGLRADASAVFRRADDLRADYVRWTARTAQSHLTKVSAKILEAVREADDVATLDMVVRRAVETNQGTYEAMYQTIYGRLVPIFAQMAYDEHAQAA